MSALFRTTKAAYHYYPLLPDGTLDSYHPFIVQTNEIIVFMEEKRICWSGPHRSPCTGSRDQGTALFLVGGRVASGSFSLQQMISYGTIEKLP